MHKIVLFGGTTEGRLLTEFLSQNKVPAIVCVATEYGEKVLEYEPPVIVQPKRLKPDPMRKLFEDEQTEFVFDATHPYATEISKHIKQVKQTAPDVYYYVTVRPNSASRKKISNWEQISNALELAWTFCRIYLSDVRSYNFPFFLSRIIASLLKMLSKKLRAA